MVLTKTKKRRRECPTVAELLLLLLLQQLLLYVPRGSQIVNDDFRLRSGYKPHITYAERTDFVWRHHSVGEFFLEARSRTQNEQKNKTKQKQTNKHTITISYKETAKQTNE